MSLRHAGVVHSALFESNLSKDFFFFPDDILLQRWINEDTSFQSLGIFHINFLTP